MSEEEYLYNKALKLEKDHILLLFEKEKYNNQQKKWFLESKIIDAKKNNNQELINLYNEILKMIK